MAVDTLGHRLALRVTSAAEQDRAQVAHLAEAVQAVAGGGVGLAYVDQAYTGDEPAEAAAAHGIRLEVVKHDGPKRGFVLLPRRWVVIACTELPNRGSSGPRRSSEGGCARWAMTTAVRG